MSANQVGGKIMSELKAMAMSVLTSFLCVLMLLNAALARAEDHPPKSFDIGAQSLAAALSEFARQSQREILFAPEIVNEKMTKGVHGTFPPLTALSTLLRDTGLTFSTT